MLDRASCFSSYLSRNKLDGSNTECCAVLLADFVAQGRCEASAEANGAKRSERVPEFLFFECFSADHSMAQCSVLAEQMRKHLLERGSEATERPKGADRLTSDVLFVDFSELCAILKLETVPLFASGVLIGACSTVGVERFPFLRLYGVFARIDRTLGLSNQCL